MYASGRFYDAPLILQSTPKRFASPMPTLREEIRVMVAGDARSAQRAGKSIDRYGDVAIARTVEFSCERRFGGAAGMRLQGRAEASAGKAR